MEIALTPKEITKLRAEQPASLNGHGGDHKSDEFQGSDYYLEESETGRGADYLTARIARDRPDILADMRAGKYRSVRAAAIDAGIIDPDCYQVTAPR